jgi:hypothetical protein
MTSWAKYKALSFLQEATDEILVRLQANASSRGFSVSPIAREAWRKTIEEMKWFLETIELRMGVEEWGILLEYQIPRRALRPDVVLLARGTVYVIEFKIDSDVFDRSALMQVSEYAQDLRDFHRESLGRKIVPVLIASRVDGEPSIRSVDDADVSVHCLNSGIQLAHVVTETIENEDEQLDLDAWDASDYQPTPDILSAAREVFAGHQVREIEFNYADNLTLTVDAIRKYVQNARDQSRHTVIFVTGVPGSGKTLAGLSAVHDNSLGYFEGHQPLGAYLSGNGPLVDVLQYALAQDFRRREKASELDARRRVKTFIQPVHLYIREYSKIGSIPPDHVIVFDEAQRAWDSRQMTVKQSIDASEPEVILDALGRVRTWAALVALVGEGQEINRGEAGISEWARVLENRNEWDVVIAPALSERFLNLGARASHDPSLHLSVNVRSPRARAIADWADALVNGDLALAKDIISLFPQYPLRMTRSLDEARSYLRDRVHLGSDQIDRRIGLLASSQARRLRSFGVEMSTSFQAGIDWPRWFVDGPEDVRSSYALEIAASEFKCQGLEIDWAGVCWGDDYVWQSKSTSWKARRLRGSSWVVDGDLTHARNRYRVLLTRARYGQIIWVPKPFGHEALVDAAGLDATADALLEAGVKPLH